MVTREILPQARRWLRQFPAVGLLGPRQCGKSTPIGDGVDVAPLPDLSAGGAEVSHRELLGEIPVPGHATGAPITYMVAGKQYIVIPTGGSVQPQAVFALSL